MRRCASFVKERLFSRRADAPRANGGSRSVSVGGLVCAAAVAILAVRTCLAWLPGLNPASLWHDDLVWAAITRAQDFATMVTVPAHAPPGFFVALWGMRMVFGDPEWSLQLLPFLCGMAAIPIMAVVAWRLTRSTGLALLAAALTALNPLLAHYTVYVKPYSFEFLVTALLLWAGTSLVGPGGRPDDETYARRLVRLSALASAAVFFAVTSVFAAGPLVNLAAIHAWWTRRRIRTKSVLAAVAYDLAVAVAFLLLRNRTNERVRSDFRVGFMRTDSLEAAWRFLGERARHLVETGLPSWRDTDLWDPTGVSWPLPIVGLGLVWLLARRSTRLMGLLMVGFTGAMVAASALRVYPITRGRVAIFAFPAVIALAVMGVHALSERLPRRELVRMAAGLAAAVWAVCVPLRPAYWAVDDARLVRRVAALSSPDDGLILSPNGSYLTAYYGDWPVRISGSGRISNATAATIDRPLTVYLQRDEDPRPSIDLLVAESHPERIWYVGFRSGDNEAVVATLAEHGYALDEAGQSVRGRLYFAQRPIPWADGEE